MALVLTGMKKYNVYLGDSAAVATAFREAARGRKGSLARALSPA